jgi:hypothetical protein
MADVARDGVVLYVRGVQTRVVDGVLILIDVVIGAHGAPYNWTNRKSSM